MNVLPFNLRFIGGKFLTTSLDTLASRRFKMWQQEKLCSHHFNASRMCTTLYTYNCLHHPRVDVGIPGDTFTVGLTESPTPQIPHLSTNISELLPLFGTRETVSTSPISVSIEWEFLQFHTILFQTPATVWYSSGLENPKSQTAMTKSRSTTIDSGGNRSIVDNRVPEEESIARIQWHIPRLLTSFGTREPVSGNPCTALRLMTALNSHSLLPKQVTFWCSSAY